MNETEYNARLYEKMKAEQDKYRDWLLHQEPSEILNHTYESSTSSWWTPTSPPARSCIEPSPRQLNQSFLPPFSKDGRSNILQMTPNIKPRQREATLQLASAVFF